MGKSEKRRLKKIRSAILAANGGLCTICNKEPATTIDHILPKAVGGTNEQHNLRGACPGCNGKKGSKVPPDAPAPGPAALKNRSKHAPLTRFKKKIVASDEVPSPWNGEWLAPLPRGVR